MAKKTSSTLKRLPKAGDDIQEVVLKMNWTQSTIYRQIVEMLSLAVCTCDKKGNISFYNKAAEDLWDYQPQLGKAFWPAPLKIYYPDGKPLQVDQYPMMLALKEKQDITDREFILERADGSRRNIRSQSRLIYDETGMPAGVVDILLDITSQKATENDTGRLAAIVQSSEDAIISKTLDGTITSWNSAAERLFGYSPEEMIGAPIMKLIPEDRLDEEPEIIRQLKQGKRVEHFETQRKKKDGTLVDISLTISPIKDKKGVIIGASKIARDITSQKILNNAVRENEERLRLAIQSTQLGTWEYYPLEGELIWSDQCRNIFGVPADAKVNYNLFLNYVFLDDQGIVNAAIQKAMDTAGDGKYEIQFRITRHDDKQVRWIKTYGKVYFDDQNRAKRFIGTVLDITSEKEEERELRDIVELFQTMADNVPAMIWMSGSDKFNDYFNKAWLDFTGKTREEESNEGWLKQVHPQDVQKCIDTYQAALKHRKGFYLEYRLLHRDGKYRWISDNCVPRTDPHGKFAGFISACIDIDDQKRFREKIQDNELLFKTISNVAPVGLWMTDIHGMNTFVNDIWIQWTGDPIEAQLGTGWLNRVLEEDKIAAPSKFMECMEKKEKYIAEFRIIGKDGQLRWCLTEGSPFYDINGTFSGYAGSVTDITDMKKIEQRKDDFIQMASHELKTPITSIKGYVQLLLSMYENNNEETILSIQPTVKSSLQTVSKQVSKLTRLISELLDLTRIESGKLELQKTEFDPVALVEETIMDMRHTAPKHTFVFNNSFDGFVYADRDRIAQVLINLLTNAVKYSPETGPIEVNVRHENDRVAIDVKDEGIGIDPKECRRIFERFYRVEGKNEQTYPGFGIGLFIANEIVQRHGGTIGVQSEKDQGSIFTFTLPVIKKDML